MSTVNKDDDWTELDEKFKTLLLEMFENVEDSCPKYKSRVDYSFVEDEYGDQRPNEEDMNRRDIRWYDKGRSGFLKMASRVAIILMTVLIAGSGLAVWINSEPANALKFQIEKQFYEMKGGGFATEDSGENEDELGYIDIEITDMRDIYKAKELMPNLPVPEYMPKGYYLDKLTISKAVNGITTAEYIYKCKETYIYISIFQTEGSRKYNIASEGELLDVKGTKVCIWEDKMTDTVGCSFVYRGLTTSVTGHLVKEDIIKIVSGIK